MKDSQITTDDAGARLWRVTVEYELLVVADTERQAESEAEYYAGEDGSEPSLTVATKVHKIEDVPADWQDSIPFGGDRKDERTCRERVTPNGLPPRRSDERAQPASTDGGRYMSTEKRTSYLYGNCVAASDVAKLAEAHWVIAQHPAMFVRAFHGGRAFYVKKTETGFRFHEFDQSLNGETEEVTLQ